MTDFLRFYKSMTRAFLPLAALAAVACQQDDSSAAPPEDIRAVAVEVGLPETRAFANDQTHHVDRILILPFRKSAENLPDDNANFLPAYTFAKQVDVSLFPLNQAILHLPVNITYKVLVIGYNHADYDFNNRNSPANLFDMGAVSTPVTLANFHLFPKSPTIVPEFFTCVANVYNGATLVGSTFKPEQGYTLNGTLKRLVSGFSLTITGIPTFVKSMTLSAEKLVKSFRAIDAAATQWQSVGDGGNRVLGKKTPSGGSVSFSFYLLPTFTTYRTQLYLAVEFGSTSQTYNVKVDDDTVYTDDRFIFKPNEAINLTGTYSRINFGFTLSYGINLDDDRWDGIQ